MQEAAFACNKREINTISSLLPAALCWGLAALHPIFWEGMLTEPAQQDSQQPVLISTIQPCPWTEGPEG